MTMPPRIWLLAVVGVDDPAAVEGGEEPGDADLASLLVHADLTELGAVRAVRVAAPVLGAGGVGLRVERLLAEALQDGGERLSPRGVVPEVDAFAASKDVFAVAISYSTTTSVAAYAACSRVSATTTATGCP
jgi:hypothetical protein